MSYMYVLQSYMYVLHYTSYMHVLHPRPTRTSYTYVLSRLAVASQHVATTRCRHRAGRRGSSGAHRLVGEEDVDVGQQPQHRLLEDGAEERRRQVHHERPVVRRRVRAHLDHRVRADGEREALQTRAARHAVTSIRIRIATHLIRSMIKHKNDHNIGYDCRSGDPY